MKGLIPWIILAIAPTLVADANPDGEALFKQNCAICHGRDGRGETPTGRAMKVKDLGSAVVQSKSNAELIKIISDGKGQMPAYKSKLDQAQVDALIAFIRALKK
jgi:cytochrome c6